MSTKDLFRKLACLIIVIFIVNFLANYFHWYYTIWWFDMPMHFSGGFWLGLVFFWLISFKNTPLVFDMNLILRVLAWVLFVGILWELFEYYFINHLAQNPFDLMDTLSDLFFDFFGGSCAILYLWKKQQR